MSQTSTLRAATPEHAADSELERLERQSAQRARLVTRHSHRLRDLMETRSDLHGVSAMADFRDEAVRWSA